MVIIARQTATGSYEWAYVSAWRDLDHFRGWRELRYADAITDLDVFGVAPVFEIHGGEYTLRVEEVAPSRATYNDGKPRRWQAQLGKRTTILPSMLPDVIEFSRQQRPNQARGAEDKS